MKTAQGRVEEIYLNGSARIHCPPDMIPSPGQYLYVHADSSDAPLPVSIFPSLILPSSGFRSAPTIPAAWRPGELLVVRGPIGNGFSLPVNSRRIALVAFSNSPARLLGLIAPALKKQAEIVLLCDSQIMNISEAVEVQPMKALPDVLAWTDFAAMDVDRGNLDRLRERLARAGQTAAKVEAQVLLHTPMPCGGIADCGVCALTLGHDWRMICKAGPVFELGELL